MWETHRLSNILDILLQPYTKYVKSYIKGTKYSPQKLPENIDENSILVTFDVENVFSNFPHNLGLEAIEFWINEYPDGLPNRISKEFIINSIKLILENNSLCFNDIYNFLRTKGTAMGTKFAPVYATLVFAHLEEKIYEKSEADFNQTFSLYLETNLKRFFDDCFLKFKQQEKDLDKFHLLLNSLHPKIVTENCIVHETGQPKIKFCGKS